MFFFRFKRDDAPETMVEFWEEKRCLVCKVYKAKIFVADPNNAFKLVEEIKVEPSTYNTMNMLYEMRATREQQAVNYIIKNILCDMRLIPKSEELNQVEEEGEGV